MLVASGHCSVSVSQNAAPEKPGDPHDPNNLLCAAAQLPVVAKVANSYSDCGVRFLAINVGEEAAEVKQFLQDHELDLTVVLDGDGKISNQYSVSAIPQTALVGKSGIVEVVHVGSDAVDNANAPDYRKAIRYHRNNTGDSLPGKFR